MMLDVEQFAARWALEAITSRELPAAAVQALTDGHDGPALRQLAAEIDPIRSYVARTEQVRAEPAAEGANERWLTTNW